MSATSRPAQGNTGSAGNVPTAQVHRGMTSPTYFKPAPAEIRRGHLRFLITDRPSDLTMNQFIEELHKHNAVAVVRVCEPTYDTKPLENAGFQVLDWEFSDGSPPPKEVRDRWIALARSTFQQEKGKAPSQGQDKDKCIAVHCVAGLGRAPALVAIALMESGMSYEDAVELIRASRRGALNQKQLSYLEKYKPSGELKKMANGQKHKDCAIM